MRRPALIRLLCVVAALAGLSLVVSGFRATGAAFTDSETITVAISSGSVAIGHDGDGLEFSSAPLAPGDAAAATVRVTNSGTLAATLSLGREHLESTSPAGCAVRDALQLEIVEDVDGDPGTAGDRTRIADGALTDVAASAALGAIAPGAARTYELTLTFEAQNGASAADNDNCFEGSIDRERFTWSSVEVQP